MRAPTQIPEDPAELEALLQRLARPKILDRVLGLGAPWQSRRVGLAVGLATARALTLLAIVLASAVAAAHLATEGLGSGGRLGELLRGIGIMGVGYHIGGALAGWLFDRLAPLRRWAAGSVLTAFACATAAFAGVGLAMPLLDARFALWAGRAGCQLPRWRGHRGHSGRVAHCTLRTWAPTAA